MSDTSMPQLSADQIAQLERLSDRTGRPVSELLRTAVDAFLRQSNTNITDLAEKIADKNEELYRRLAQ